MRCHSDAGFTDGFHPRSVGGGPSLATENTSSRLNAKESLAFRDRASLRRRSAIRCSTAVERAPLSPLAPPFALSCAVAAFICEVA